MAKGRLEARITVTSRLDHQVPLGQFAASNAYPRPNSLASHPPRRQTETRAGLCASDLNCVCVGQKNILDGIGDKTGLWAGWKMAAVNARADNTYPPMGLICR